MVGGFDGTRQLATVERYDTENETWDMVAPIQIARSALSLTTLDGKLYAIGGFDGNNFLSIVEVFDPRSNTWEQGTPLNSGRSGHASAVIYQPSCASTFMDYEESVTPKRDDSNDERQTDSSQYPFGGKSLTFSGISSNMQFHASYGAAGCHNCESNIKPNDTALLALRKKYITNKMTDNNLGKYKNCHFPKAPSNLINTQRRCLLTPMYIAMQNIILKSCEWHYKKDTTSS